MAASVVFGAIFRSVNRNLLTIARPSIYPCRFYVEDGSPVPPKKPLPPFMAFHSKILSDLKQKNPGSRYIELSKISGSMWREMSEEEKQTYRLRYEEQYDEYKSEHSTFLNGLTPTQFKTLKLETEKKRARKQRTKAKNRDRALNKPKRPGNSFSEFMRSQKDNRGSLRPVEHVRNLSQNWKTMSIEEKQVYIDEARKQQARYQYDLGTWEQQMIAEGRPEVVRGFSKNKSKPAKKSKAKPKKRTVSKKTAKIAAKKRTSKSIGTQTDEDPSWMREE